MIRDPVVQTAFGPPALGLRLHTLTKSVTGLEGTNDMPTIDSSQGTIHYEQVGEGPDIVWVSGGGGLAEDWDPYQLPYFKEDFRNTTFDNRGIGTTECTAVARWAQGFTFDDEHLGLDIIEEVGPTGHFLASRHTRDHMGEFWRAKHMDSSSWEQWEAAGSPDAVASAEAEVRRILAEHEPEPLEDPVTTELRRIVAAYEAEARADAEDDED